MAKTNQQKDIGIKTLLLISREEFISELKERIEIGRKLLDIQVEQVNRSPYNYGGFYNPRANGIRYNEQQYWQLRSEFIKWNDYNIELLKQRFNKPNNEYHANYVSCGQTICIVGGDRLKLLRDEITDKIHNLESLIDKLPLIQIEDNSLINYTTINSVKSKFLIESKKSS